MSKIISVTAFFTENPLWKLLKQLDGKPTASYKSNTFNGAIECKKCTEQIERRGTAGFKCLRCRRTVDVTPAGVVTIVEPSDEKELTMQEKGMARDPKKIYDEDEDEDEDDEEEPAPVPVPVKKTKKKTMLTAQEMEDLVPSTKKKTSKKTVVPVEESSDEEVTAPTGLFMDLDLLAEFASKTSGLETAAETAKTKRLVERRKEHLTKRALARVKQSESDDDSIDEDPTTTTTTTTGYVPVTPAKKLRERGTSKLNDCSGLVKKEIVLKSGDTYFVAELGLMIRVE